MIIYVDMEHRRHYDHPERSQEAYARQLKIKYRLEEIGDTQCLIIHYTQLSLERVEQLPVKALFISGNFTDWVYYDQRDMAGLRQIIKEARWPIMGFCGGCQIIAETQGGSIGPMGPRQSGDPPPNAAHALWPGLRQERGFMPVRMEETHPLFAGLGNEPVVFQAHYWEVKELPPGFRSIASSDLCAIQTIANDELRQYGTQFHPEQYDLDHQDGMQMLQNFACHIVQPDRARAVKARR
jgi:GMP synthase (glutamine-hydrolysing)